MATRGIEFFMTPQEFSDFISIDLAPLDLELILVEGGGWTSSDQHPSRPHYLAPRGVKRPVTSRLDILHPAREGWLCVTPPFVEKKTLYLADISAKDQWIDLDTKTTTTNPEVLRLFGRVARRLRKKLEFSVVGSSILTHKSVVYKSIGHSEGARAWLESSGEWKQQGNENAIFNPP
jgi:hypothetical protein